MLEDSERQMKIAHIPLLFSYVIESFNVGDVREPSPNSERKVCLQVVDIFAVESDVFTDHILFTPLTVIQLHDRDDQDVLSLPDLI